ncbi:hypothetical protein I7I53_10754 [Histoplasma capsulatum var. duboisii H88]|uniref:Uncharacterized protein n=1 Tax=Ajellomyces capsulatus (strain H88) TaxID=544711 RepID=A0A8A1LED8_AJEC8|nr:hypothetical protein I7I53_10754 [Histoplasma capsulatum var. duboisii H88]
MNHPWMCQLRIGARQAPLHFVKSDLAQIKTRRCIRPILLFIIITLAHPENPQAMKLQG